MTQRIYAQSKGLCIEIECFSSGFAIWSNFTRLNQVWDMVKNDISGTIFLPMMLLSLQKHHHVLCHWSCHPTSKTLQFSLDLLQSGQVSNANCLVACVGQWQWQEIEVPSSFSCLLTKWLAPSLFLCMSAILSWSC